jgi:hypothetical protein
MAIDLKLSACIDNCTSLLIYDNTLEQSGSNTGGWSNTNPNPNDSITAVLTITHPDLTVETVTLDVTDLPSSVTTKFLLATVDLTGTGKYKIVYTITIQDDSDNPTVTYTRSNCLEIFNLCSLRCCVDKMWVKVYDNNDCCCSKDYMKTAMEAEALYKAIQHATGSVEDQTRNILIKKLERICKLAECNCK